MRCFAEAPHDAAGSADGDADGDAPPRRTHVLEASVADRGRGMSAQQCDSIFQPYEAAASSAGGGACSTRCIRHGYAAADVLLFVAGTGLGLFISRACARRAGGDVSVVSAPGCGATFTLRFPVHVPSAAAAAWAAAAAAFRQQPTTEKQSPTPPAAPAAPPPPGTPSPAKRARVEGGAAAAAAPACVTAPPQQQQQLRCLLADDAMLNLLLVQRLLQQHAGFAVRTAVNGREAYDLLVAACVAGEPPHIAVLDMQMPQARALRLHALRMHPHTAVC
jgi:CheY-like chemotaxis protein